MIRYIDEIKKTKKILWQLRFFLQNSNILSLFKQNNSVEQYKLPSAPPHKQRNFVVGRKEAAVVGVGG